jgi:hypothetical protein
LARNKRKTREDAWQAHYKLLLQFVKREGHSRVPARHEENGFRLGRWVHAQRQNRDKLTEERTKALEALEDWNWTGQDAKWNRGYRLLGQYVEREGHALVPKPHVEEDFALGVWVMHQRAGYRKSRLSEERVSRLEKVPGWAWYPREATATAAASGAAAERLPRHVSSASIDELTEEGWKLLFGLGPLTLQKTLDLMASGLHDKGLIRSRTSRQGTRTGDLLYEVIETALEYGYMDMPEPDHYRAVLVNAEDYEPDDWRMCVFNSIEDESIEREEAVVRAAKWAKDNLGLEYSRLSKNGVVWKHLDEAIETAIREKEIKQTVFYGVIKIQSLI